MKLRHITTATVLLIASLSVMGCQNAAFTRRGAGKSEPLAEVAFLRGGDIWVSAADGSGARRVTDLQACLEMSVSPDGTKAAVICGGDSDIPDETRLMIADLLDGAAAQAETDGCPMGVDCHPMALRSRTARRIWVMMRPS